MNNLGLLNVLDEFKSIQNRMDSGLFLLAILTSLAAAFIASALYRFFYESRATGSQVHRAFPLLAVAITTLFITVQLSIPLSLGMLGTLSIIRFRTPIKEPEEIGFIMVVIAASVCAATLNFRFILVLYAVVLLGLVLARGARTWRILRRDGILVLTMADAAAEEGLGKITSYLENNIGRSRLETTSSRDGITSVQMSFAGLKTDVVALQNDLRKLAPLETVNVFLDRPGGLR